MSNPLNITLADAKADPAFEKARADYYASIAQETEDISKSMEMVRRLKTFSVMLFDVDHRVFGNVDEADLFPFDVGSIKFELKMEFSELTDAQKAVVMEYFDSVSKNTDYRKIEVEIDEYLMSDRYANISNKAKNFLLARSLFDLYLMELFGYSN